MLDFFIVFFGGFYFLMKFFEEQSKNRRADLRYKELVEGDKKKSQDWKQAVLNPELEKEMEEIARERWMEEPYYSEIVAALKELGWNKRIKLLENSKENGYKEECYWYERRLILMCNRGFLPRKECGSGLSMGWEKERDRYLNPEGGEEHRYELMILVTKRLREHGLDIYPVQWSSGTCEYRYLTKENFRCSEKLVWDSMAPYGKEILGSPDKSLYSC